MALKYYQEEIHNVAAQDFKVGGNVQLKSGGPVMTISKIAEDGAKRVVTCVWFHQGEFRERGFLTDVLNKSS